MSMTNIKTIRIGRGFTQPQLAEKAGVNVRVLQHYEQGSKNIDGAKLDTLLSIADALECKVADIVEGEELKEKIKDRF